MKFGLPPGFSWDDSLKISNVPSDLTRELWPNYIVEESDIKEDEIAFEMTQDEFDRRFPVWGIREDSSKKLIAYISAVQLYTDLSKNSLPDEGWSFAANSYADKNTPNCICLLAANVNRDFRKNGFSEALIEKAKYESKKMGFSQIIAPVRPTLKHKFSELTMNDYLLKKTETGDFFDPWIQSHVSQGAKVLNVCNKSVVVKASISKWQKWSGLQFEKSGDYIIPNALAKLKINLVNNVGIYNEPNVWVRYDF